jgi:competence protein ComEC
VNFSPEIKKIFRRFSKKLFVWSGIFICVALPIIFRTLYLNAGQSHVRDVVSHFMYEKATVSGFIDSDPEIKGATQSFTVWTETVSDLSSATPLATRILVNAKLYPRYVYGDRLELTGKLAEPRNFSDNSGSVTAAGADESNTDSIGDSRTFDYVHYLSKDGILYILKNPAIVVEDSNVGNPIFSALYHFKDAFLQNIRRALGDPQASLAGGLVVGEKSALGKSLLDDFRRSGLIHVVILSGYSINIIAASVRSLLSFLPRTPSLISSAVGIILFGILVGGKATVVRACAMALVAIIAQLFYRDYNALRALLLVAYLMVLQNPYIVPYDASFQVSFVSTLGLILFGRHIEAALARWPRLFPERFGIRSLITSTLATQISVAPLLLYMMGDASLVGVFANLLVLPLIPVTMVAVTACGMTGFLSGFLISISASVIFSYLSLATTAAAYALLSYQLFVVQFFASIPFAVFEVRDFRAWMMWLTYCGYAIVFIYLRFQHKSTSDYLLTKEDKKPQNLNAVKVTLVQDILKRVTSNTSNRYSNIPEPIVILDREIASIIGDTVICLSEFVVAKIKGLIPDVQSHPEINDEMLCNLPRVLMRPFKILKDTRTDRKYIFVHNDPLHEIVVEVKRQASGKTEINTVHLIHVRELKRLEHKFPTVFSSSAEDPHFL